MQSEVVQIFKLNFSISEHLKRNFFNRGGRVISFGCKYNFQGATNLKNICTDLEGVIQNIRSSEHETVRLKVCNLTKNYGKQRDNNG